MDSKRIAWLPRDEEKNKSLYGISFGLAEEVIRNSVSFQCRNIHGDFAFIGLTNNMNHVLYVYCVDEEGFRKIKRARIATIEEENIFFFALSGGQNGRS